MFAKGQQLKSVNWVELDDVLQHVLEAVSLIQSLPVELIEVARKSSPKIIPINCTIKMTYITDIFSNLKKINRLNKDDSFLYRFSYILVYPPG